ncbi:MAG TPA: MaoC/PaaZ C-terminal domain-containing protein, partial [Longimicrobiaceae bacterium]|nr:MaoC/PaaZ C-terminal domain-containing protein [Longimicrobiaceae bacterium]
RTWTGAAQLCSAGRAAFRGRRRGSAVPREGERPRAAEAGPAALPAGWEEVASWSRGGGAGRRYARASGDYNPIHLWGWTARPFGFRRPILHGFCTAALRRLGIAFRAPLLLPARVRLVAGELGGRHAFRVVPEDGGRTFAEGDFTGM